MDDMTLRIRVFIYILFVVQIRGAVLHTKEDVISSNLTNLQYHDNLTSLWVLDERGWLKEAYLRGKSPTSDRNLRDYNDCKPSFYLYTKDYRGAFQLINGDLGRLKSSTFKPSALTKVLFHGFWNNFQSDAVQIVKEGYLRLNKDMNIMLVDWGTEAKGPWYTEAVAYTLCVGVKTAAMVDFLGNNGANTSEYHFIGHSLGAHVASFTANNVKSGRIARITGLDPALPLFASRPPSGRLDPSDAAMVDCIHSCGGYLGFYSPICVMDFYPNGGTLSQPACHWDFTGACSHSMAFRYFAVTMSNNEFRAKSCASLDEIRHKSCSGEVNGIMGDQATQSQPGLYYLETGADYPYTKS